MEQYRSMAQMEAAFRVKEKTGFDMSEYKQRLALSEAERRREEKEQKQSSRPKPKLPATVTSTGEVYDEPNLPFTRANRLFVQSSRARNNRNQVTEISSGVLVPTVTNNIVNPKYEHSEYTERVKCWGCTSDLLVKKASFVQCPKCLTLSPVIDMSQNTTKDKHLSKEKMKK